MGHVTLEVLCSKIPVQPPPAKVGSGTERREQTKGNKGDVS